MENQLSLVEQAEQYATAILSSLPENMIYHNQNHTREVVKAATKIGMYHNLTAEEIEVLLIAAWMHDTGFSRQYHDHESASVDLATEFMKKVNYPKAKADKVVAAILTTRVGQVPETLIECVLHDADYSHISKKSYFDKLQLLRDERKRILGQDKSDRVWYEENLDFLSAHQFYTEYGKVLFQPKAFENIVKQQKLLKKFNQLQDAAMGKDLHLDADQLKALKKKLKKVEGRPDRGIETMFRLTSRNHLQLSSMADSKANILISVNSIIISVIISGFLKTLDDHPHLLIPTYMILSINVITIVFSILTLRPNVTKGKFSRKDIEEKNTNLLFFGNFHDMEREDYKWGMTQMMGDSNYLYSSLIDDIYFLGKVLGTKYRYLRWSYNIFMYGIILAVLAYIFSNYLFLNTI